MNLTVAEHLTAQFYMWEQRGRGWYIWDYPVVLEPPFETFSLYYPSTTPNIDDGKRPTLLSSFVDWLNKPSDDPETITQESIPQETEEITPEIFQCSHEIKSVAIQLPKNFKFGNEYMQRFLINLSICSYPVSFEIVGTEESIHIQFTCREPDYPFLKQSIHTYFSDIAVTEGIDILDSSKYSVIVDYGLSEEFMRPIQTFKTFDPDPLLGMLGILEHLQKDEQIVLQVLFQSASSPWTEEILNSVTNYDGSSFFADAPEMVTLTKEKLQHPLFSVVIRTACQSYSSERSWELARSLNGSMNPYRRQFSNELIPLSNEAYDDSIHLEDVELRQTHRSGMLLNSNELMGFVHFPSDSIRLSKLKRSTRKTRSASSITENNDLIIGENIHQELKKTVSLNHEQRIRHTYVLGATGTGKSTLLLNMIRQDMEKGLGLAVIDPHGELIERVLDYVPESRLEDVVLFNPSETEHTIGFNVIEARTEIEKNVLSSDLVALFRRFSTSWGDQMTAVLGNAVSAFLEHSEGGTLVELKKFLIDKEYRDNFLRNVHDDQIRYFWEKEFPLLRGKAEGSILTRLDTFLRPKLMRNIVSQRKGIDLEQILNNKKILLVKLAQGIIGDENAYLLGTLLVSKLHQVVMGRQSLNLTEREPFYLYIDEFQNLVTPSMTALLSGARKYAFGLVLAHQDLRQLWEHDTALANSVISNPYTRICFRVGDFDAQKLSGGFAHFDSNDLQNIGIGEAIVRVERIEQDFNLKTFLPPAVDPEVARKNRESVYKSSQERYTHVSTHVKESFYNIPSEQIESLKKSMKPDTSEVVKPVKKKPEPKEDQTTISQHRYLQTLIKKMAEQRGYKAVVEKPVLDGTGRVDVSLERGKENIACEISITTNKEHELNNIRKCLNAGYDLIFVCSVEQKHLDEIKKISESELSTEEQKKVLYFQPEQLFLYLEQKIHKKDVGKKEKRVKGYRVKVSYNDVTEEERIQKEKAIANVILKSMRTMKR